MLTYESEASRRGTSAKASWQIPMAPGLCLSLMPGILSTAVYGNQGILVKVSLFATSSLVRAAVAISVTETFDILVWL